MPIAPAVEPDFESLQAAIRERLAQNKRLRRNLPGGGRLRIDRQLPFLCLYRSPRGRADAGTRELVTTEAAYLFASGEEQHQAGLHDLCQAISETLQDHFGTLLFLELWAAPGEEPGRSPWDHLRPGFEIVTEEAEQLPSTLESLAEALADISLDGTRPDVRVIHQAQVSPPDLPNLSKCTAGTPGCVWLGLAVRPIYRDPQTGDLYPVVLQQLRRQLSIALRRAIFAFAGVKSAKPKRKLHFDSLGPSTMVKAVRLVDQRLSDISETFDFLLQVTPVNSEQAFEQFCESNGSRTPDFYYRPLPYDPRLLKRRLFEVPLERIEDPTLSLLFQEKQDELDRQLAALRDLGTPRFRYGSLQLYGAPDETLIAAARRILEIDADGASTHGGNGCLDAAQIAERAQEEIDSYHARQPSFTARVEICNDIASGLMVAGDRLFVSESFQASPVRVRALLHHEVGTHLLTYFNGREQPFQQMYAGLAGYEALQEGLAVFAEYVVGGLTVSRLRTIAARVLAAEAMLNDASFPETFAMLHEQYGFGRRSAFTTTLRAYRGGGFTKDIIYLRGLTELLEYLRQGHEIEPLYVGKIALTHVPFVQELRRRGVIRPPALLPRLWQEEDFRERLEACRGRSVIELLEPRS